jgi:hypothetical protein
MVSTDNPSIEPLLYAHPLRDTSNYYVPGYAPQITVFAKVKTAIQTEL